MEKSFNIDPLLAEEIIKCVEENRKFLKELKANEIKFNYQHDTLSADCLSIVKS